MYQKKCVYSLMASLAAVLFPLNAALGEPGSESAHVQTSESATNLHFVERAVTDIPLDLGAAGDSLGDLLTFVNPIYDTTNTTMVGENQGFCSLNNVGVSYYCTFMAMFEGGNIALAGPFYIDGRDSVFAITGGTGVYREARGELTFSFRSEEAGVPTFDMNFSLAE